MRTFPKNKDDQAEAVKLNAEKWQVDLLKLNPSYVYWGNEERKKILQGMILIPDGITYAV